MLMLWGGGSSPLKTIEFTATNLKNVNALIIRASDLVSAGVEFPRYNTPVFVTAILKKNSEIVGTAIMPFALQLSGGVTYNMPLITNNAGSLATTSSVGGGAGGIIRASSATSSSGTLEDTRCNYNYSSVPDFDEAVCFLSYYLIEK